MRNNLGIQGVFEPYQGHAYSGALTRTLSTDT